MSFDPIADDLFGVPPYARPQRPRPQVPRSTTALTVNEAYINRSHDDSGIDHNLVLAENEGDHVVDVYQSLLQLSRKVTDLEKYVNTHILKKQFSSDVTSEITKFL